MLASHRSPACCRLPVSRGLLASHGPAAARPASRTGFTLVELLVTVMVVAVFIGISVPAIYAVRQRASKTTCQAHLRDIGVAMRLYLDAPRNVNTFPDAAQLPSIDSKKRPPLYKALSSVDRNLQPLFQCPDDDKYFESEGLSYEYPAARLANRKVSEVIRGRSGRAIAESTVIVLYDYESFHEGIMLGRGRNFLYLDGHVDDGVDDNPDQPPESQTGANSPEGSSEGSSGSSGSSGSDSSSSP